MSQDGLWGEATAPPSADTDSGREGRVTPYGPPAVTLVVHGKPAPQGSKHGRPIYRGKGPAREFTGKVAQVESSKAGVNLWRGDVMAAAQEFITAAVLGEPGTVLERITAPGQWAPLDGELAVQAVFTMRNRPKARPSWWPPGREWSRHLWYRPAGTPDVSKLLRSTEDALTAAGIWRDDARVVEFVGPTGKWYCGHPRQPDVLAVPGAVIRIWRLA